MSTITIAKKNGYGAIAADSLSLWGDSKDSAEYVVNHQKILQVADSHIAVCGSTALKVVLKEYFSRVEGKVCLDSVDEIFGVWKRMHEVLKDEYFLHPNEDDNDSFESSRMDVLILNPQGIFGVTGHRAVQEFSRFYAYGNGREYALGAMFAYFDDEAKTAIDIVRIGVEAAAKFDTSTELPAISFEIAQTGSGGAV